MEIYIIERITSARLSGIFPGIPDALRSKIANEKEPVLILSSLSVAEILKMNYEFATILFSLPDTFYADILYEKGEERVVTIDPNEVKKIVRGFIMKK